MGGFLSNVKGFRKPGTQQGSWDGAFMYDTSLYARFFLLTQCGNVRR